MDSDNRRLVEALALQLFEPRPKRLAAALLHDSRSTAQIALQALRHSGQRTVEETVERLIRREITATYLGDDTYPPSLAELPSPPPVLFLLGSPALLHIPAIGVCGSRSASDVGLVAARTCGDQVAAHGLVLVSGYAKGVDTEAHLGALGRGGRTILVLAEGIDHFRMKRAYLETGLPADRMLVMSQFQPSLRWNVGSAMARNAVIAGLSHALVVVEAGEKGGTLNAGLQALAVNRPVVALQFSTQATPAGNQRLIDKGAIPVSTREDFGRLLAHLKTSPLSSRQGLGQQSLL